MYGKDYPYAQSRIQGTIVRVQKSGEPVYVVLVTGTGHCSVTPIDKEWGGDESFVIHVDELDLRPVPLGYVNCAGEACYLMRVPLRRDWKQGLRQENCWSSGRRFSQISMKSVKNCIINRYPSFDVAIKDVNKADAKGKVKTIAWHRNWAINSNGQVMYKNHEVVGTLSDTKVILDPCFKHLNEVLQESLK